MPKRNKRNKLAKPETLSAAIEVVEELQLSNAEEAFLQELEKPSEAELYEEGKAYLEQMLNCIILPDSSHSSTCSLSLLILANWKPEPGITLPEGFCYAELINSSKYKQINASWRSIIKSMADQLTIAHAMFWFPLIGKQPKTVSTELELFVKKLLSADELWAKQYQSLAGYKQGIAISPAKAMANQLAPRAFLPELCWFGKEYDGLKPSDIITIMPPDELELFCLFLGRTCAGRSHSIPVGEQDPLSHKFRKLVMIYGKDPQTGKSTLLEYLTQALQSCGYGVANFRSISDRFGMGSIYTSDMAVRDDSTQASAAKLLASDSMKMLVTGTQMQVENKGQNAYTVVPTCSVLFITNELDQNVLFSQDSGVIDRLAILYTYSHAELKRLGEKSDSPNLVTYFHLSWLAKQKGLTIRGLMLWLLRHCLDKFMSHLYAGTLESYTQHLTSRLRFPTSHHSLPNVVSAIVLSHLIRGGALLPLSNKKTFALMCNSFAFVAADLNAHHARNLIKADWESKGRPVLHPWRGFSLVSKPSIRHMLTEANTGVTTLAVDIEALLKQTFTKLKTEQGICIGSSKLHITKAWQECVNTLLAGTLKQLANYVISEHKANAKLASSLSAIQNIGLAPQLDYIEDIGFNPLSTAILLNDKMNEEDLDQYNFPELIANA